MNNQINMLKIITDPISSIGSLKPIDWLKEINQPFYFKIQGKDSSRTRVLTTLLHGNEPSGFYALINWLKQGKIPAVDIICIIPSVRAAITAPHFHNRTTQSGIDLNRVFAPPFNTEEGQIAKEILSIVDQVNPECLVDIHNTSGISPDFSVANQDSKLNKKIASLFTNEFIIFNLTLNTLVETLSHRMPAIAVECGGAEDPESVINAEKGIDQYFSIDRLESIEDKKLTVRDNPVRVKLKPGFKLDYYHEYVDEFDLILPTDADKYNSKPLEKGDFIGWIGSRGLATFECFNMNSRESIEDFFYTENNSFFAKQNLKLYMVTTRLEIALKDCIFYIMKEKQKD